MDKSDFVLSEKAPALWDERIKSNPADTWALHMRGIGWLTKGEYDNAIQDFNDHIQHDPKVAIVYLWRGIALSRKNETDKAIADFDEAIRLDPKLQMAYNRRGKAWSGKQNYEKAIADYDEAIKLDPKYDHAFVNRAFAWHEKGEYEKALADWNVAIELDPRGESVLGSLAWFRATCPNAKYRDGRNAVVYAKRLVEHYPAAWDNHDILAAAYAEAGDFENAVKVQTKAIDIQKAEKNPDKGTLSKSEKRLELYKAKKPYRDE